MQYIIVQESRWTKYQKVDFNEVVTLNHSAIFTWIAEN